MVNDRKKINAAGLEIIKHFESCRLEAYRDPVGVWTIGWGHTGPAVREGLRWSQGRADEQLKLDVAHFEKAVIANTTVAINLNRFSACVSLAYNIGATGFRKSPVCSSINSLRMKTAAASFALHVYARGQRLLGLVRRRAAEALLFATPASQQPNKIAWQLLGLGSKP